MLSFTASFAKLRFCAIVLLAGRLLISSAAAAPTTDTHPPLAKRQPVAATKPKTTLPATGGKQTASPAPAAAPVASVLVAAPEAPQTVQLKGIVLAPNGQPCAGASVYPAGAPRQLVVTDAQGAFTLPVPASGPLSLRVEYFGEGSSRVEVLSPGSGPLRITLGK
ncbi:carboxypeptidase regulatory-like domain-containing protein [Hymenobacter cheonanensis]|uniref:carboxypeptidase regulatory-like domain-containing protein n=1 Tax=Hymenobacter sp. CA2-7 TaxID=3063993 RepID=UPI00271338DD|nr:carboxypeptidase regulatory-like domain-containing protein [Hymenobacter sp. CA2-7]MDO7884052.1 carboxypeptidase regulatory-like domain-containing protein [Hymenobacter sp. CA2-7]